MVLNCTEPIINGTRKACENDIGVNVAGLIAVIIFYLVILAIGLYASWRSKRYQATAGEESTEMMLAGRNIGLVVGIFTMTATWVGGGFINGTAEVVYNSDYGLVWAQAPVGYSISLVLGGLLFAKKMRKNKYTTMLDPFEDRYGSAMAGLLYIPALLGEVFWSAAILSALGASLAVILNMNLNISIIISAAIAVFYTVIGGLYSVAFTDVIQLLCIFIGLWLGVGFSIANDVVTPITQTRSTWLGSLTADPVISSYIDSFLLLIFGGIPWQVYFQRVLSSKSESRAQMLSFVAAFGCLFMSVPAVLIGAIGKSADWASTSYPGAIPIPPEDYGLILPLVLQYLCPTAVSVIGLGAVSAAVMSSADSSVLSASSMFARNIYRPIRNACSSKPASETEIIWVVRVSILLVGVLATLTAILVKSIYGLWYLCSDLVYAILFPQLLLVIYFDYSNTYGALTGFLLGLFFRLIGGEPLLSLPALVKYPWFVEATPDTDEYQQFPFKTLSMMISLISIVVASLVSHWLFTRQILPEEADIFHCFHDVDEEDDFTWEKKKGEDNPTYMRDKEATTKF